MLLKMAWRNIWRKKKRSLITMTALAGGVLGIMFIHSFGEGVWGAVIKMTTSAFLGHMQVRGNGWEDEPAIYKTVPDPIAVEAALKQTLPDAATLPRVMGFGLAAGEELSTGVMIMGLDPARERGSSDLLAIQRGRDLGDVAAREIVVGEDLATQLELELDEELVLLGQAADGSMANDLYKVVGLADAGTQEMNGGAVFLHLADAQEFFALENGVHQILVNLDGNPEEVSGPLAALRGALDLKALEVLSWNEIAPELEAVVRQKRGGWKFFDFIVFFIVGLGVFNVMAMSTFERTRELGIMASLGTRRRRIVGLILTEAMLLGAVSLVVGIALALALLYGVGTVDLSAMAEQDLMGFRFPSHIEARPTSAAFINATATVVLTTLAGAIWPAWKASRLKPVDAVRYV